MKFTVVAAHAPRVLAVVVGVICAGVIGIAAHAQSREIRAVRADAPQAVRETMMTQALGSSRIGVSIDDVGSSDVAAMKLTSESGVIIRDVEDGMPGAAAGMRAGDVIIEFDGERVRSARQLSRLIQETPAGRNVTAVVWRDGRQMPLTVTPEAGPTSFSWSGEMPMHFEPPLIPVPPRAPAAPRAPSLEGHTAPVLPSPPAPPVPPRAWRVPEMEALRGGLVRSFGGSRLGVTAVTLTEQLAKHYGVSHGVLVSEVVADSAAAKAGISAGDIIIKAGSQSVERTGDLQRAVMRLDGGADLSIEIVRAGKAQTVKVTVEAAAQPTMRRVI